MLIELSYICTQFMKYQNMRGGRVKLHHIMVRYLLFFSAQKAKDINLLSAFQNERTSAGFLLNCQQRK